jgi:beta-lactamase regulating signal transducer with metallopeptidase domain
MRVVDALNGFAERGCAWAAASLVEAGLLLAVVGLVLYLAGRRVPPAVAHLLLLAVLVKAVLPLGIPTPRVELPEWSERAEVVATAPQVVVAPAEVKSAAVAPMPVAAERGESTENADAVVAEQSPGNAVAAVATASAPAMSIALSWKAWALLAWMVVVLGLALRRVHAQIKLRRAIWSSVPFDDSLVGLVRELALRLGVRRSIAVISGPNSIAPAVAGVWRPTLIIPRDLPRQLRAEQLRWVLLHELAHVRRGDLITLWLVTAAECVAFFNPAVWVAARWAEYFRECACDELAWRHADCEPAACGEAFLTLLEPAMVRPSQALGFRSTQRQMRRRLLRLLEPAPGDRRRVTAVAIACVGILGLFSVTQPASRAEGEVRVANTSNDSKAEEETKGDETTETDEVAAIAKSPEEEFLARTRADVDRIWEEQTRRITSGRVVVHQLRMSSSVKDPLQQGHELKRMSKSEVEAVLNSIDFRDDPSCVRKVRDRLLEGNLILDQPSARPVEVIWNSEANRWNWPEQLTVVWDGKKQISYDPVSRQADIYPLNYAIYSAARSIGVMDYLKSERWRMLVHYTPPQMGGMLKYGKRPSVQRMMSLDDGTRRVVFDNVVRLSNYGDVQKPLVWTIGKDGQLASVDECFQNHVRRNVSFKEYPHNIVSPRVTIDAEYSYSNSWDGEIVYGSLLGITVTMLEQAEFNIEIPAETFRVAVPANTAVWDRRKELKLRAAEVATEDVLTLFER